MDWVGSFVNAPAVNLALITFFCVSLAFMWMIRATLSACRAQWLRLWATSTPCWRRCCSTSPRTAATPPRGLPGEPWSDDGGLFWLLQGGMKSWLLVKRADHNYERGHQSTSLTSTGTSRVSFCIAFAEGPRCLVDRTGYWNQEIPQCLLDRWAARRGSRPGKGPGGCERLTRWGLPRSI